MEELVFVKTVPSLGNRKLTLPVVGSVEVKNGVFECPSSKLEELLSLEIGCEMNPVSAASAKAIIQGGVPNPKPEEDKESPDPADDLNHDKGDKVPAEDDEKGGPDDEPKYEDMKVAELNAVLEDIKSGELCTQEEYEEILKKNKPEKINFIQEKLK